MSLLLRYTRQCTCRAPRRLQPCSRRFYNSSRQPFFRFLDNIPQNTVLWSIIGLNGLVFGVSWWARKKYEVERDPSMLLFLQKHFQTNWQNLKAGRFWTLVTSMFAHSSTDLTHILFNGFTFYFMAPLTLSILGSRQFLFLYLGGGVVADLFSISYKNVVQNGRDPYTLGASAAIYSMISFLAFTAPRMTILIYGIVPVPIWLAVTGLFTYETYLTASQKGGTSDTTGHIGGILSGACYFLLRRFRVL